MMADRGEAVNLSSCRQTARKPDGISHAEGMERSLKRLFAKMLGWGKQRVGWRNGFPVQR